MKYKRKPRCLGPLPNFPIEKKENMNLWNVSVIGDYFETDGKKYYIYKKEVITHPDDYKDYQVWLESEYEWNHGTAL